MAILAKLAKTIALAAKAGAHTAAEAPGHVRGHFATNSKTGVKSWVRDYTRKVSLVDRTPKVAKAGRNVAAKTAAFKKAEAASDRLRDTITDFDAIASHKVSLAQAAETKAFAAKEAAAKSHASVRTKAAKGIKEALGTKLKPATARSSEHKAFDVYHRGRHLGTVQSYTSSSKRVEGKNKWQPTKPRTRWEAHAKQQSGGKYLRSDMDLPDKNYAVKMLKLMHGISR